MAAALVDDGLLRRRAGTYFPGAGRRSASRRWTSAGSTGGQIAIVETGTGRLLGGVGAGQAPATVHPGAVYLHQGESYVVDSLDFEEAIAFVHAEDPGYATYARELTDIAVTGAGERIAVRRRRPWAWCRSTVTNTVVGYLRRATVRGGASTSSNWTCRPAPCPPLRSMYTITPEALERNGIDPLRIPGLVARRRARRDRPAAAGGQLRPRRHRRAVHRGRARTDCRRSSSTTATRAGRDSPSAASGRPATWLGATAAAIEACECPRGLPVVRAVAQVRQRQRPAGQGRGGRGAAHGAGRAGVTTDPSTVDPAGTTRTVDTRRASTLAPVRVLLEA